MAQMESRPPYEIEMLLATYRFPSQTWFSRRIVATICLWIIGALVTFALNPFVGLVIISSGIALGAYVFEKGYRYGGGGGRWRWERMPIETTIEERLYHYRKRFRRLFALSVLLLIGPWAILLPVSAWYYETWMMLVTGPTLLITFYFGVNCLEQAVYCRRASRALAGAS